MDVKERLILFIEHLGMNPSSFEKECGISNGYVNNIRKSIGTTVLERILVKYPNLYRNWLLNGEGSMLIEQSDIQPGLVVHNPPSPKRHKHPVKFYDIDLLAGNSPIQFYDDTNMIEVAYEMDIPEFAGCTGFRAYSDSMEPLIKSGSILFGTKLDDWPSHLEYGQIYGIICTDGRRYLKYIRKHPTDQVHYFMLRSENSEMYDDFELPKKKIKSLWLVNGWLNKRT